MDLKQLNDENLSIVNGGKPAGGHGSGTGGGPVAAVATVPAVATASAGCATLFAGFSGNATQDTKRPPRPAVSLLLRLDAPRAHSMIGTCLAALRGAVPWTRGSSSTSI